MKSAFSLSWITSKQPRKQRKYRYNAPMHIRGKFLQAPLSQELRKKHETRTLRVKVGDKVKILRGQFKGKETKVERINLTKTVLYLADIGVTKKSGEKTFYPVNASNVMITSLVDVKSRFKNVEAKKTSANKTEAKPTKVEAKKEGK